MQLDELLDQREPEAEAAPRAVQRLRLLHEEVEHAREEVGVMPLPGVADAQDRLAALHAGDAP